MKHKKVDLYFGDSLARFEVELHDHDCFSVLMDYEQWKLERAKKRERELKQLESEGK